MRLRSFFNRFRKPKFSSIRILQPYQNRFRFELVLKKRNLQIRNIQQMTQAHYHQTQTNIYQLHVSMQKLNQFPISIQQIKKIQPLCPSFIQTTMLPIQQLQDMSDTFIQNSIQKQQEYYKYHPTAAKQASLAILQQSSSFQRLPSSIDLHMRETLKPKVSLAQPKERTSYVKTTVETIEYRRLMEDVIQQVEQRMELKQRRRGHS